MANYIKRAYAASDAIVAIRRQREPGYYHRALTALTKLLMTSITMTLSPNMSDVGIEIGSGSNSEQRSLKESIMPMLELNGHVRTGAILNLLAAMGYKPISYGTAVSGGGAFASTLARAHVRQRRAIQLASVTGLSVGQYLQVSALASAGNPAITDTAEVHKIAAILASGASEVNVITVYGSPTGGTFKLIATNADGTSYTTAPIAYNASNSAVATALTALSNIGATNVTVTGSAGGPWTVTAANSLANSAFPALTVDDSGLVGGTGFGSQAGIAKNSMVDVLITTEGTGANSVLLTGALLYNQANAVAVTKVDATVGTKSRFFHVQASDAMDNDGFTMLVAVSGADTPFNVLYMDGKCTKFDIQMQKGSICTFSATMQFQDVIRVPDLSAITFNSDPGSFLLNSTRGSFSFLGQSRIAPTGVNISWGSNIGEDFAIFQYLPQSLTHIDHKLGLTTSGRFVEGYMSLINFNGGNTLSDVVPEYPLSFTFESQNLITTGVPYSLSIVASDVQYAQMNPTLQGGQLVTADIGMIKVVPNATTQAESWYADLVSTVTSDDFAAI